MFRPSFIGRQNSDPAGRDVQVFAAASVGAHVSTEDAVALRYGTEYSASGAVAEEDARIAVGHVEETAEDFSPDDQNVAVHARFDVLCRRNGAIGKARAGCIQIEDSGVLGTDIILDDAGR